MAHLISGPNSDFAMRLRDSRRIKGVTQEELAQCCGIAVRNISLYESGHSIPRSETLEKLAECLDSDPYFLLHGHSRETKKYFSKSKKEFQENLIKKTQLLYINEWERLSLRSHITFGQLAYTENPSSKNHSSDLNLFIPYVAPSFHFVAVKLPYNLSLSTSDIYNNYEQILIINFGFDLQEDLKDGVQIIYASLDQGEFPRLGTVKIEVGEPNIFIESIPNKFKHFEFLDTEYEILGIVEAIVSRKL